MSLLLRQCPLLLVYLWYSSLCTLTLRPLTLMTLCHSSPVLPLVGALIIVSPLLSLLSSTICFFRISCHCIWSISLLHTIPIERCASLYVIVTDAPMSFSTLFIYSLVEVHRSSAKSHGLFFRPLFIGFFWTQVQRTFLHPNLYISQLLQVPPSLGKKLLS